MAENTAFDLHAALVWLHENGFEYSALPGGGWEIRSDKLDGGINFVAASELVGWVDLRSGSGNLKGLKTVGDVHAALAWLKDNGYAYRFRDDDGHYPMMGAYTGPEDAKYKSFESLDALVQWVEERIERRERANRAAKAGS